MANKQIAVNNDFIAAAKSIAFSAASLIGPNKCIKCIVDDDGQFELTSSVLKLLQVIKVDHPAIFIIYDVCKGFHKSYGTCCSTLVFMMGSWLQSIEFLIDQGVPLPIVSHLFKEAIHICTQEAEKQSFTISKLTQFSSQGESTSQDTEREFGGETERESFSAMKIDKGRDTSFSGKSIAGISNVFPDSRKVARGRALNFSSRYSRHFMESDKTQRQQEALLILSKGIKRLSCGVARGNKIVEKLLIRLLEFNKDARRLSELKVSLDNIFIEFIDGRSEMESTVFEGLCVTANATDVGELYHMFQNQPLRVCLIDFDKTKYSKQMVSNEEGSVESSMQKLLLFQISCVIYRGERRNLTEDCLSKGIIPLRISSPKQLYSISIATGNPVVSSLNELQLKDVKMPIKLTSIGNIHEPVGRGGKSHAIKSIISLKFCTETEEKYFTILLCGMTSAMTLLLQESLWSSLNRLNNILNTGKCVIGSGRIEQRCTEKLFNDSEKMYQSPPGRSVPRWMEQELRIYKRTVFTEVARGLQRYCTRLSQCNDPSASEDHVIDDVFSKCEAWRRALRLVDMISRVDVVVTKE